MERLVNKYAIHLDSLRREKKLSVEEICEGICEPRSFWRYVERERNISQHKLIQFCNKLNISITDFFYSANTRETDEFKKVQKLYQYIINRDYSSYFSELKDIDKDKLLSNRNIRYYEYCYVLASLETNKINSLNASDKFSVICDYPSCIGNNAYDFIDLLCLTQISKIEIKRDKVQALNRLIQVLEDLTLIYISYDNKNVFPSIYANASLHLSRLNRYTDAINIINKGLKFCLKYNDISSLAHLRYLKSYCLLKIGERTEAEIEAAKCLHACISTDNSNLMKTFKKEISDDFNCDVLDILLRNIHTSFK